MVGSDDTFDDQERLTERECVALFERVFPSGLGGEDVLDEIAPTGWERSPLLAVFHPSVEQIYRETVRVRQNIRRLTGRMPARAADPDPTLAEIAASHVERPIERDVEIRELVGRCLWDIFSDNHDVIGPDGRLADIGSFRGAGAFIAELVNRELPDARYDYLDFYMGTICVSDRADLTPVYAMIFRRLAEHGYDWKYAFPRLSAVYFDRPGEPLAASLERERERTELQALMDDTHREALERAKDQPPPATVIAYRRVYGTEPPGWPPRG
ncbi:MAG: hypothetical protein HYU41_06320 [Candidatus Rokubacteria bacterium]|nr:hypothetical protein [Candidatus Rokubacteria bacterium]